MPYEVLDPTLAEPAPITNAGAPLTSVGETLETLKEDLYLALGNRSDVQSGGSLANFPDRWINRGYKYIASMLDIKELWASVDFTFIPDAHFYAIPDSVVWIKRMMLQDDTDYVNDGGVEMDMIDEETYRTLPNSDEVQDNGANLPPRVYFRYGRMIVIWPTPVVQFTAPMDFRARPQDLVEDDDSPILQPEFHPVISLAGIWMAQKALRLRQDAAITQNDMLTMLRPLMNSDAEERSAMHMVAQPIRRRSQLVRTRGEP